jgi:uncharacterized protein (TIGR04255 family)
VILASQVNAGDTNAATDISMNSAVQYPNLPHAPIIEAVIDWRAKLPAGFNTASLKKVGESFGSNYRFAEEERQFQLGFKQQPGIETEFISRELGTSGYRFRSQDGLEVAVLSQTGFSFSRLKPYSRWEAVFGEATRLWSIYREKCQVEEISRIATRYINRILFPLPVDDFGQYLTAPPKAPPDARQDFALWLSRMLLHDPASGIFTNLVEVIEGPPEDGQIPFILDIDAYILKTLKPDADEEVSSRFAALREMKNRVFFATLTTEAINMFK